MAILTPLQIRAKYEAVIGVTATSQLAAAGLLPTIMEESWSMVNDSTNTSVRTVVWRLNQRLATSWAPAQAPQSTTLTASIINTAKGTK